MFVFQTVPKSASRPPRQKNIKDTEEIPVSKTVYSQEQLGGFQTGFHQWVKNTYPDIYDHLSRQERIRLPSGRQIILPGEQIFKLKDFYMSLITREGQTPDGAKFWTSQFLERAKTPFYRPDSPAFIEQHELNAPEMMAITRFLWKLNTKNEELKQKAFDKDHYLEEFAHNPMAGEDRGWALLLIDQREWGNQHGGTGNNQLYWLAELLGSAYGLKTTQAGTRFSLNTGSATREEILAVNLTKSVFLEAFRKSGFTKSEAEKAARNLSMKFVPE